MVLAPRSWPSRPGLATTIRYGRFTAVDPRSCPPGAHISPRAGHQPASHRERRLTRSVGAQDRPAERAGGHQADDLASLDDRDDRDEAIGVGRGDLVEDGIGQVGVQNGHL